ncbi:hypothetical protein CPB97_008154 [Podila verticillata]|nr:hypothetical protein CPB97_008154 [Podila verticillata]
MANTLAVYITSDPGSIVQVPFTPYEPIYYVLERISNVLGQDPQKVRGRKLYVNSLPILDLSKSVDYYRILGNGFSYSSQSTGGFGIYIQKDATLHLVLRLRGGLSLTSTLGVKFADVSDQTAIQRIPFSKDVPPGRICCYGTNIECRCDCNDGKYLVICKQSFDIVELTSANFKCPVCHRACLSPVTAGFVGCKFRFHGIKTSGEQYTSEWMATAVKDGYARFDPKKQASWYRLMIESVSLHGAAHHGRCMMCLEKMWEPKELTCGHHYHAECFARWDRCPTCHYNKSLTTGVWTQ